MGANLTYNVCWGLSLLEWESSRRVMERPARGKPWLKYSDTLFPVFAFLTGFRPLSPRQSLFTIGLGVARNVLVGKSVASIGSLQSIGLAALLLHTLSAAQPAPLLSVGSIYLLIRYVAARRQRRAPPPPPPPSAEPQGQDAAQKDVVQKDDVQAPMGIATTAATMWLGRCVADGFFSSNDLFITGVSLVSFGHLSSYALPNLFAATAARWSPGSALGASGISLLNYTATTLGCRLLLHYGVGTSVLGVLSAVGAHAFELYILSSALEAIGVPQRVQERAAGWKGRVLAALVTNSLLIAAALGLDHFKISDKLYLPYI